MGETIEQPAEPRLEQPLEFEARLPVSKSALERVASGDNPTMSLDIGQFKLHIAALITRLEKLRDQPPDSDHLPASIVRAGCAAKAIDHLEVALLFAERALKAK